MKTAQERAETLPHVHFENGCGWCDRVTAAILAHAEAVREVCEAAMCPHCRDGLPIHKTWGYGGEGYELWLHLSEDRTSAFPCQASALRAIQVT